MNLFFKRPLSLFLFALITAFLVAPRSAIAQVEELPVPTESSALPETPLPTIDPPGDVEADEADELGYDVIFQGPVHEAFAVPIDSDPTDGVRVIAKAPPKPVDEQPPEARSEEEGMTWIPGYWAWDDDRDDYLWVSGLWRKFPPGRNWKPGYWSETASGHYRWTTGYWVNEQETSTATNYLPMPPKSIDNGPSVPPPNDDYFWVPGHWEYAGNDYRWQSGFWSTQPNDWVWQPACYIYTPQGYVLVDGYWDYLPTARGQLYSPVRFYQPVYLRPNYVYRPRYPLANAASLLLHLFVRPGYSHYYFGDYYGRSYASLGYRPWYDFGLGYGYRSPWLGYYNWTYRRSGIDFVSSMKRYENHLRANSSQRVSAKPPVPDRSSRSREVATDRFRFDRTLDEAVRSDVGRVAINRGERQFRNASGQGLGSPSSRFSTPGSSASGGASNLRGNLGRGTNSRDGLSGIAGRSNGIPSLNSRAPTSNLRVPSSNRIDPLSNTRLPANVGRSNSFPSIGRPGNGVTGPSIDRSREGIRLPSSRSTGSPALQRDFSPTPLRNFSPTPQRSITPSFNPSRGSSRGITGRGNAGGSSNRGSIIGGGSSNRGGIIGGGSRSSGSRGRGRGK